MSDTRNWAIAEPSEGLLLQAEATGLWIRAGAAGISNPHQLRSYPPRSRLGRLLPTVVLQLVDMGLASVEDGGVCIQYPEFVHLKAQHNVDAFEGVVPWAPLTVEMETARWPGNEGFRYFIRFYAGRLLVSPERLGCFVRFGGKCYQLDLQTFSLVEAVESFNALPPLEKAGREAFIKFAEIKDLAEGVGAQLDEFLLRERVIVPSSIGVDVIAEPDGHISFAPKIDSVPQEAFREAFLASDDIEQVYSMDDHNGGRVRVVLDEDQREALRRMQRVRHLGGSRKASVLRDPASVFDGVVGSVDIGFGPRVQGVGDFPFVAHPFLQRSSTGVFDDPDRAEYGQPAKIDAGVKCHYADGTEEEVRFDSREQLRRFYNDAKNAFSTGQGYVDLRGKSILVDEALVAAMDEQVRWLFPLDGKADRSKREKSPRKYLLIYTNENEVEYEEDVEPRQDVFYLDIPKSVYQEKLEAHQLKGLQWLEGNFRQGRHGCLLADDMGLGKTLQVLTFLAWVIEQGQIAKGSPDAETAPWNPILIVAPLTLIENETWIEDMQKFFSANGSIFQPWLIFYKSKLKEFKRKDLQGRETEIGQPLLDLERFRQYRVVLTNYDTIVNYQHSFAAMKDRWSIVVTDEAQEYKTPSTKISHALKSLSPRFRIACTGTPVETRLLDIWNIFDFLQPGQLLGSAKEFSERYERQDGEGGVPDSLSSLRDRLQYGSRSAFVLRREKSTLAGLPAKHEHVLNCDLSPDQRKWHIDFVQRARTGGPDNHPFSLLHQLMMVYQHPSLVPSYDAPSPEDAISRCPKLAATIDCLRKIERRGEKVLLFTRSLHMQDILARTIEAEFGTQVDILNGRVAHSGATRRLRQTRKGMVDRFRQSEGFSALVLSPEVAGVGLTLVEANHVVHYGRWWNPARESQATDRVYRIGQEKDVHVYYPIATDPEHSFRSFDEILDGVIRRRRTLASEFLAPLPSEDDVQRDVMTDVVGSQSGTEQVANLSPDDVRLLPWDKFEALAALLEEKRGAKVILTPRAGDDMVDVIALRSNQMRLIQCKHSAWSAYVDADVVAETLSAVDIYRSRYMREIAGSVSMSSVIVSNGTFTTGARSEAGERDVELVGDLDLWKLLKETPCTRAEVEMSESRRLASMRDVRAGLRVFMVQ